MEKQIIGQEKFVPTVHIAIKLVMGYATRIEMDRKMSDERRKTRFWEMILLLQLLLINKSIYIWGKISSGWHKFKSGWGDYCVPWWCHYGCGTS